MRTKLFLIFAGGIVLLVVAFKLPLVNQPKKQYLVGKSGTIEKVPVASESGSVVKPIIESLSTDNIVGGNEFAKWGVLDYYPGGYHVAYPDGFTISYTPSQFVAVSPAGGKVTLAISGQNFKVETDLSGASEGQRQIIEAAGRLISGSFRFLSGSGYDMNAAKARFGK